MQLSGERARNPCRKDAQGIEMPKLRMRTRLENVPGECGRRVLEKARADEWSMLPNRVQRERYSALMPWCVSIRVD